MANKSIDIQAHLSHLLNGEKKVIIPNLGRISLIHKAPQKGKDGKLLPPTLSYGFSSVFRKDDSVLTNHVAKQEKMSKSQAQNLVINYVNTIQRNLKEKGQHPFPFGILKLSNGILSFSQVEKKSDFGLSAVKMPQTGQPEQRKKTTVTPPSKTTQTTTGTSRKTSLSSPQTGQQPPAPVSPRKKQNKKKPPVIIWILLVLLLLGGGAAGYYFYNPEHAMSLVNTVKNQLFGEEVITPTVVQDTTTVADTVSADDTMLVADTVPLLDYSTDIEEPPVVINGDRPEYISEDYQVKRLGLYYVVHEGFAYRLNAEKALMKIQNRYPKAMIFRTSFRFYYVAIGYFDNVQEAQTFINQNVGEFDIVDGKTPLWYKQY